MAICDWPALKLGPVHLTGNALLKLQVRSRAWSGAEHRDRDVDPLGLHVGLAEPAQQRVLVGDPLLEHEVRVLHARRQVVDEVVVAALVVGHRLDLGGEPGDLGEVAERRRGQRDLELDGRDEEREGGHVGRVLAGRLGMVGEEVAHLLALGEQVAPEALEDELVGGFEVLLGRRRGGRSGSGAGRRCAPLGRRLRRRSGRQPERIGERREARQPRRRRRERGSSHCSARRSPVPGVHRSRPQADRAHHRQGPGPGPRAHRAHRHRRPDRRARQGHRAHSWRRAPDQRARQGHRHPWPDQRAHRAHRHPWPDQPVRQARPSGPWPDQPIRQVHRRPSPDRRAPRVRPSGPWPDQPIRQVHRRPSPDRRAPRVRPSGPWPDQPIRQVHRRPSPDRRAPRVRPSGPWPDQPIRQVHRRPSPDRRAPRVHP